MKDEIVEEIHKYREELAEQFDCDVRKMLEYMRERQGKSGRKVVSLLKRKSETKEIDNVKKVA